MSKTLEPLQAPAEVDGRHRYYACQEVGAEPTFRTYDGDDPVGFVISLNLKRRHLNESQRAMVAASLANLSKGRPKENAGIPAVSQPEAAKMLSVSRDSVQTAAKVEREAPVEVVEAVKTGVMSLNLAFGFLAPGRSTEASATLAIDARGTTQAIDIVLLPWTLRGASNR